MLLLHFTHASDQQILLHVGHVRHAISLEVFAATGILASKLRYISVYDQRVWLLVWLNQ